MTSVQHTSPIITPGQVVITLSEEEASALNALLGRGITCPRNREGFIGGLVRLVMTAGVPPTHKRKTQVLEPGFFFMPIV